MIPEKDIKIELYRKKGAPVNLPDNCVKATTGKFVEEDRDRFYCINFDRAIERLNELVFPEKKYKDISEFFERKGPDDIERFVDKNLDISQFVYARMKEKGWKVKDLAEAVGKSVNKVSKWLTGCHDLTLRDITRMESALGVDIITVSK